MRRENCIRKYVHGGFTLLPLNGKIPAAKAWSEADFELFEPEDLPRNYGVALPDSIVVIDVDPRNFVDGVNSFSLLKAYAGWSGPPDTFIVATGGGGFHIYLKKPREIKIRNSIPEWPGLEFKTKGRYVVGPGSIHPDTKREYAVREDMDWKDLPYLDKTVLEAIKVKERTGAESIDYVQDSQSEARFIKYLENYEAAVEGALGDTQTFKAACRGRDFGLEESKTYDILSIFYNPRCCPPWGEEELLAKVRNAYRYNDDPVGGRHPESDFPDTPEKIEEQNLVASEELDLDSKGKLRRTLKNAVYCISIDDRLKNILRFNEFCRDIEFLRPAPWAPHLQSQLWTDAHAINCKFYLAVQRKFEVPISLIHEAAAVVAHHDTTHPVREFLESLEWDGKRRLDRWLSTYAGVSDTEYSRTVGRKTLVAAVSRAFKPGCKFDYMLILEGAQGIGKSQICKVLGGEWYGDIQLDVGSKDTVDALRGKWVIEVSEMECTTRTESNALKAFISRETDRMRPAYARTTEDFPRQNIFIGTINPEAEGYLKDNTGNRRFWPVSCHGSLDFRGLRRDITQIWAEAVDCMRRGEPLYLENKKVMEAALAEAEKRRVRDPWGDLIWDYINAPDEQGARKENISTREIFETCIGGRGVQLKRFESARISSVMREFGWEKVSFRKDGVSRRGFRKLQVGV
jgi:predicted P-loop ATPase